MNDKIILTNEDGTSKEVNLITFLTLEKYNSCYVVYTEEELKEEKNEVCFAKIVEEDGKSYFTNIDDIEERNALFEAFKKEALK